jgi:hypothetical protein
LNAFAKIEYLAGNLIRICVEAVVHSGISAFGRRGFTSVFNQRAGEDQSRMGGVRSLSARVMRVITTHDRVSYLGIDSVESDFA